MDTVKIGRAIAHYRTLIGMTQTALADAVEMDQGNLSRLENGQQDVSATTLELIAKSLGIKTSDLYLYAESEDALSARWRRLYIGMDEDERKAALRILEPRERYKNNG